MNAAHGSSRFLRASLSFWTGLAAVACAAKADNDPKAFARYYSDGAEWCEVQEQCQGTPSEDCLRSWPTEREVLDAIERTRLGAAELERCETSSRTLDACYYAQTCEEPNPELAVCTSETERFEIDCAALLAALQSDAPVSDAEASAPGSALSLANVVCDKAEECDGQALSSAERSECENYSEMVFGLLLPNPEATQSCISRTSCEELESDTEGIVTACIDVDPSQTFCDGEQTLHLCNSEGTCRDIGCATACPLASASAVGCGFNDAVGYDQCLCEL